MHLLASKKQATLRRSIRSTTLISVGSRSETGARKSQSLSRRVKGTCVSRRKEQWTSRDARRNPRQLLHNAPPAGTRLHAASARNAKPQGKTCRCCYVQEKEHGLRRGRCAAAGPAKRAQSLSCSASTDGYCAVSPRREVQNGTMDRVEKLGTNISLAIARESAAPQPPPLREKLP